MTVLGKILAIVNLVLSLAVAAFLVMSYVARTNWHDAYKDLEAQLRVADNNAKTFHADTEVARQNVAKARKDVETAQKNAKDAEDRLSRQVQSLQESLAAEQKKFRELEQNWILAKTEVDNRQQEVAYLKKGIDQLQVKIRDQEKTVQDARDLATSKEIEALARRDQNDRLNDELERLTKELRRAQSTAGTLVRETANGTRKNPPPEDVEGIVKKTDATSGYVELSVGSDAGLARGQTMEVYRLQPVPAYLGTIEILAVQSDKAVGKPSSRIKGVIQVGDKVATNVVIPR